MSDNNDDYLEDDDYGLDDSFDDDFDLDDFELEDDQTDGGDTGDDGAMSDSDFTDTDDCGELDESPASELGAEKEKKSFVPSLSFNTIVIVGAVIVGALVLVFQVTNTKAPQSNPQDNFVSTVRMQGATDGLIFGEDQVDSADINQSASVDEVNEGNAPSDFLNNPDALDSLEIEIKDAPPMPTPIVTEATNEFLDEFNQPLANTEITDIENMPRAPIVNGTVTEQADSSLTNTDISSEDAAPDNQLITESQETQVELETNVEIPAIELDVEKEEVSVRPSVDNRDLEDRLATLENKVESVASPVTNDNSAQIEKLNKTVSTLKNEIARLKIQAKSANTPSRSTSRVSANKPAIEWDLRAAQPGKAWVSQQGSKQLQPVVVGDMLSGIGRVQNIFYDNNRWVIKGSTKNIYQKTNKKQ